LQIGRNGLFNQPSLIADIKVHYEIVNNPTAMMKVVELARERTEEGSKTMPTRIYRLLMVQQL
jgi:hypothetical protein